MGPLEFWGGYSFQGLRALRPRFCSLGPRVGWVWFGVWGSLRPRATELPDWDPCCYKEFAGESSSRIGEPEWDMSFPKGSNVVLFWL